MEAKMEATEATEATEAEKREAMLGKKEATETGSEEMMTETEKREAMLGKKEATETGSEEMMTETDQTEEDIAKRALTRKERKDEIRKGKLQVELQRRARFHERMDTLRVERTRFTSPAEYGDFLYQVFPIETSEADDRKSPKLYEVRSAEEVILSDLEEKYFPVTAQLEKNNDDKNTMKEIMTAANASRFEYQISRKKTATACGKNQGTETSSRVKTEDKGKNGSKGKKGRANRKKAKPKAND